MLEELEQRLLLSADLNPVAGAIDVPGETDLYVFTLDKPQTVYFDSQTSVSGLTWSLNGPSGTQVTAQPLNTTDTTTASPVLTLASGDYTLSVSGVGNVTGSYQFHLLDLANAMPVQTDSPVVGQLFPGSASNLYSFDATPGQHVFLDRTSGGDDGSLTWRLFDKNGTQISYSAFGDRDLASLTLGGRYTLAIEGAANNDTPENYSFSVSSVNDVQAPLTLNATTSGTIAKPGQRDTYIFTLAAPTSVYFDSLSDDANLTWSLTGPRGVERGPTAFNASDAGAAGTTGSVLNLVAGDYRLNVSGTGDHTGDFGFRLSSLPSGSNVALGQPITATLDTANATQFYKFGVSALDNITINPRSVSGETPYWRLFDGYGRQIWAADVGAGSQTIASAPGAGTYTLAIEGRVSATTPAVVSFEIDKGTPDTAPAPGTALTLGALVSGTLTTPTQTYTFTLATATSLYFDVVNYTNGVQWSLAGPRGIEVPPYQLSASYANSPTDPYGIVDLVAGTYTLTLSTTGAPASAVYSFRLDDLASAPTLTLGQSTTVTMGGVNTPTPLYRFNATAGDHFYFDAATFNYSLYSPVKWLLYDPYGRQVSSADFNNGADMDVPAMPVSGTYTLAFDGTPTATGTFTVYRPADVNTSVTIGAQVTGGIARGQVDRYAFHLAQDTELYFDSLLTSSNTQVKWSLTGPRGVEATAQYGYLDGSVFKLVAGDYTLSFAAEFGQTGNYAFRLLDLAAATPLTIDSLVSGTLDLPNGSRAYSFTATAGDHLYFDTQTFSGGGNWRLFNSSGHQIFQQDARNDQTTLTMAAGAYTLLLEGSYFNSQAPSYSFMVRRVINQTTPITLGSRVDGSVAAGQQNDYTFTLAAPTTLYFDSLKSNSNLSLVVTGPLGQAFSRGFSTSSSAPVTLAAGTYTATVKSQYDYDIGSYSFRLLDITTTTPLVSGQAVAAALDVPNGAVAFQFDGVAGGRFYLDKLSLTGGAGNWLLLDTFDRVVSSGQISSFPSYQLTALPATGRYRLIIDGDISNTAATSYQFTAGVPTNLSTAISLGQTVTGNTTQPGQRNDFTFTVASDTRLYFDSLTNDSSFIWGLAGPNSAFNSGNTLYGTTTNFQSGDVAVAVAAGHLHAERIQCIGSYQRILVSAGRSVVDRSGHGDAAGDQHPGVGNADPGEFDGVLFVQCIRRRPFLFRSPPACLGWLGIPSVECFWRGSSQQFERHGPGVAAFDRPLYARHRGHPGQRRPRQLQPCCRPRRQWRERLDRRQYRRRSDLPTWADADL